MGLAAGANDLAVADSAMTTLTTAMAAGGPLVQESLKGLHLLPTVDCLALSPDPAIKARAAATMAALLKAGQIESQEAQARWRDMLITCEIRIQAADALNRLFLDSPVTPASARAAAEDLRAAAAAVINGWEAAALNLPTDLMPGMFAPAVEEAYDTAARILDLSVAQQRTVQVMEVREGVSAVAGVNPLQGLRTDFLTGGAEAVGAAGVDWGDKIGRDRHTGGRSNVNDNDGSRLERDSSNFDSWEVDDGAEGVAMVGARLLSVEYKAPMTGWEGESLSLPDSGRLMLDKLVAAGVGQRPVVFVAHSMGGLLLKEMLSLSLDEAPNSSRGRLATATKAIAFYSTPHFGSSIAALGWKLRHLPGASPAPSIHHLSPGPHLAALNARLAALHDAGKVRVLSFVEGLPTSLAGLGFMPKIVIVPFESAYPGFGEVHVLAGQDHVDVCKPERKGAEGYVKLVEFIRANVADLTGLSGGT
eukprot:gene3427-3699_t